MIYVWYVAVVASYADPEQIPSFISGEEGESHEVPFLGFTPPSSEGEVSQPVGQS